MEGTLTLSRHARPQPPCPPPPPRGCRLSSPAGQSQPARAPGIAHPRTQVLRLSSLLTFPAACQSAMQALKRTVWQCVPALCRPQGACRGAIGQEGGDAHEQVHDQRSHQHASRPTPWDPPSHSHLAGLCARPGDLLARRGRAQQQVGDQRRGEHARRQADGAAGEDAVHARRAHARAVCTGSPITWQVPQGRRACLLGAVVLVCCGVCVHAVFAATLVYSIKYFRDLHCTWSSPCRRRCWLGC